MRPTTIAPAPALALAALSVALLVATATAATAADITNAWSLTARSESGAAGATDDHDTSDMDMGGMDMGDADTDGAEPAEPAHDPEGSHDGSTGAGHEDSDGGIRGEETTTTHDSTTDTGSPRPLTAVLSIFFIVNAGVLGAAARLRRRDRNNPRHRPGPAAAAPPATQPA